MKIAHLILAHKNPIQLKRLVKNLSGDIYIHIDKKKNIHEFYIDQENVFFIEKRVDINWGGWSMILATLHLLNIAHSKRKYNFYNLLSGDDYPIKSSEDFEKFLLENKEKSFIEYKNMNEFWPDNLYRFKTYRISEKSFWINKILQRILNIFINDRPMYGGFQPYKGSQWWCLNNDAITYILDYINKNPSFLRYFQHTYIPDEMFFQTLLLNSEIANTLINNNLRFIELDRRIHPKVLDMNYFTQLKEINCKYFARKFDLNQDLKILDALDTII